MFRQLINTALVGGCALTVLGAGVASAQVLPDLVADMSPDSRASGMRTRFVSTASNGGSSDVSSLAAGQTYYIRGDIRNNGLASGGRGAECRYVLRCGTTTRTFRFALTRDILPSGDVYESPTWRITIPSTARSGAASVTLEVDTKFSVTEVSETNNDDTNRTTTRCVGRRDLICERLSAGRRYSAGGTINVSFRVRNIGGDATGATRAWIMLSPDATVDETDTLLKEVPVAALSGGATIRFERISSSNDQRVMVEIPRTVPDDTPCWLGVIINPRTNYPGTRRDTTESSYSNNYDCVEAGRCYRELDYVISAFDVTRRGFGSTLVTDDCGKQLFDCFVTTKNLGRGTGGATYTLIVVSEDSTLSPDDAVVKKLEISPLGPFGERTNRFSFSIPACFKPSPDAHFFAIADAGDDDAELVEDNNQNGPISTPASAIDLPSFQSSCDPGLVAHLEFNVTLSDAFDQIEADTANITINGSSASPGKIRMCLTARDSGRFYFLVWSRNKTPFEFDAWSGLSLGALQAPWFINWLGAFPASKQVTPELDASMLGAALNGPELRSLPLYVHAAIFRSSTFLGWANDREKGYRSITSCTTRFEACATEAPCMIFDKVR